MAISEIYGTNATSAPTQQRSTDMDRDAFLQLLVAQMKNQDPLNPMEDKEFVAQLAQFSSLEQLFDVNENLKTNSTLVQSTNNALVASLIGKNVKVAGNHINLKTAENINGAFNLSSAADVSISIRDMHGNNVQTIDLGFKNKGTQEFSWNAKDDSGNNVPPGDYFFEASSINANGQSVQTTELMQGFVQQIRFSNGQAVIVLEDIEIGPEQIYEISQG
jgi:flagellar basal-body rod modification protein FlgD